MSKKFRQIPLLSKWRILKELRPIGKLSPIELHRVKPKWLNELGPVMRYSGSERFVEIYKPEDIGRLLRSDGKWPMRPVLPLMQLAIQRGHIKPSISHLNGFAWADIRTKMQKIFLSPTAATQFYRQQWQVCEEFVHTVGSLCEEEGAVKDFRAWSCRFAAESVGKVLLGAEMGSFTHDPHSPGNRLCRTMDRLFTLTAEGFSMPPWSSWFETKLYKEWIHQHHISKLLVEELISMYGFSKVSGINIDWRSTDSTSLTLPSPDSTECPVQHAEPVTDPVTEPVTGEADPSPIPHCFFSELLARRDISDQEAVDFAEELFIAGVESTGNALTFLVFHLAINQCVQERLYGEIVDCQTEDGMIANDAFHQLSYLRACMKESMRLSPPVTGTVRTTVRDIVLSDYQVPTGTIVNTGSDVICQQDAYFSNASVFDPNRWLDERRKVVPPFAYIPFGHGSRMCIGRRFVEQELMMAALLLVKEFKIELVKADLQLERVLKVFYAPDKRLDIILTRRGVLET